MIHTLVIQLRVIAVLPSETMHARQTAANTKQSPVHKKNFVTRSLYKDCY